MKKTPLEIKVLAINQLNRFTAEFYAHAIAHFSPFIGKDIFKVDGSIKAKYAYPAPSFDGQLPDGSHVSAHCWPTIFCGQLELNIKICVNGGSYEVHPVTAFCQYETARVALLGVENGILCSLQNAGNQPAIKVWDVAEIQEHAKKVIEAQKQYEAILDGFPYIFTEVCNIKRIKY